MFSTYYSWPHSRIHSHHSHPILPPPLPHSSTSFRTLRSPIFILSSSKVSTSVSVILSRVSVVLPDFFIFFISTNQLTLPLYCLAPLNLNAYSTHSAQTCLPIIFAELFHVSSQSYSLRPFIDKPRASVILGRLSNRTKKCISWLNLHLMMVHKFDKIPL